MGPAGEGMAVGLLGLTQDVRGVGFHRLHGDEQLLADLLIGVTAGQQSQHLQLTAGQRIHDRIINHSTLLNSGILLRRIDDARARTGIRGGEGIQDKPGQAWGEEGVARVHPVDGLHQFLAGDGFGDIPACPGADDGDDILGGIGDTQGEEDGLHAGLENPADHGEAATVGHVDVEKHDVGTRLGDAGDGIGHGAGLAHDLHRRTQLSLHARSEHRVVINQKHLNHAS
ncbi:putative phosphate transport protein [Corynebacterium efficiens YS-314]|uniref:Putative phosphate transport protein n=1 Tax=Corynebacterium efficiens (strain DSM 44549 / YS-314 / AJ 12310 / JCM 11189 / NBRC 100395) TaxID=196164 RepID=Q8FRY6_COREF|nr:putative phosphate transport protein [Corynebacterium efficiens YS-314]